MDAIKCPDCKKMVEAEFYTLHVTGDQSNNKTPHELKVINIPGMGGPEMVQSAKGPKMLDLPYIGRVRRDAFFYWSLGMILLGILWGKGII